MMTIKQGPRPENKFTLIANDLFRRSDISMNAKGIYGFIRSFSDGWEISVGMISESLGVSESTVKRALKELERIGYLRREQRKGERGRFTHAEYTIFAEPTIPAPEVTDDRETALTVGHQRPSDVTSENGSNRQVITDGHIRPSDVTSGDVVKQQVDDSGHRGSLVTLYKKNKEKQEEHPQHLPTVDVVPPRANGLEIVSPVTRKNTLEKKSATTHGTRLPDGWMPTDRTINQIRVEFPGIPDELLRMEHLKFSDYWAAAPGAKGRKRDWNATWRNWIRKAMERYPRGFSSPQRGQIRPNGADGKAMDWAGLLFEMQDRGEFNQGDPR